MIGLPFLWVPSEQQREAAPPTAANPFGDGYSQRYGLTVLSMGERYALVFRHRPDLDPVDLFLAARAGIEWFKWTPHRGVEQRFVCRSWSRPRQPGQVDQIIASFERVYQ